MNWKKNYRTVPKLTQNVEDLECLQAEYDQLYDYITQGAFFVPVQRDTKKVKRTTNIF